MNENEKPCPVFKAEELTQLNYVTLAEKVIKTHFDGKENTITTNQIRNFLDLTNELREQLRVSPTDTLTEKMMSQVQYIKLRIVYATGRDKDGKGVFEFVQRSNLIECLDTVGDSVQQYLLVCKYLEALVAYHKWYDTKDQIKKQEEKEEEIKRRAAKQKYGQQPRQDYKRGK